LRLSLARTAVAGWRPFPNLKLIGWFWQVAAGVMLLLLASAPHSRTGTGATANARGRWAAAAAPFVSSRPAASAGYTTWPARRRAPRVATPLPHAPGRAGARAISEGSSCAHR